MITDRAVTHALFDMDGLLLDTETIYTETTRAIVSRYGKVFDWSIKSNMIGRPSMDSARYLVETLSLPFSAEEYLQQREILLRQACPKCKALPGAEKLVTHLVNNGVPIALATSSNRELFQIKTQNHPWFCLFDAIVAGDDENVKQGKPAPDIFLWAAKLIGGEPATTLVFEDAPTGLAAAKAAGMQTVVVPDANMDKSRYRDADVILESLVEFSPDQFGLPSMSNNDKP